MADGQMTWETEHRAIIDKVKAGGYQAAIAHHTKGMLAAEVAMQAAYELGMESAGKDMTSEGALIAGKCRAFLFELKAYHCRADNEASTLLGQPVARDGSR
jgi:hypothetical protein